MTTLLKQRKKLSRQEKNTNPCNKAVTLFPCNLVFLKPIYLGNQAGSMCNPQCSTLSQLGRPLRSARRSPTVPPFWLRTTWPFSQPYTTHLGKCWDRPKRQWKAMAALRMGHWMARHQLLQQKSVWTLDPFLRMLFLPLSSFSHPNHGHRTDPETHPRDAIQCPWTRVSWSHRA